MNKVHVTHHTVNTNSDMGGRSFVFFQGIYLKQFWPLIRGL